MKRLSIPSFGYTARAYSLLMKPGIIMGNAITTAAGFSLGSRGIFDVFLFLYALVGVSLVIGSACVVNNYIDREADKRMERTKNRALAQGTISFTKAFLFAGALGACGFTVLAILTNFMTVILALIGFFVYVVLYSFSKYLSMHGTLIGSVAGALPPVIGYTAARGSMDWAAWLVFFMMVVWQMPHFFAIGIYRLQDYMAANIPILPIKKGVYLAKIHMVFYVLAFIVFSSMLSLYGYVSYHYLIVTVILGLLWLIICIQGFKADKEHLWAKKVFSFSLVVIMGVSIAMFFTTTARY